MNCLANKTKIFLGGYKILKPLLGLFFMLPIIVSGGPEKKGYMNFMNNLSGFFSENHGQISREGFLFTGTSAGARINCSKNVIEIAFPGEQTSQIASMEFLGASPTSRVVQTEIQSFYTNYYSSFGNKPIMHILASKKIIYEQLYPFIDLELCLVPKGIKYSFTIHPGANINDIKIQWDGLTSISALDNGGIHYESTRESFTEHAPIAYTSDGDTIKTAFHIHDNVVTFNVEKHSISATLVIDPKIEWSTYYGGKNETYCKSVACDDSNFVYVAGITNSDSGISTPGSYQSNYSKGGVNWGNFIAKFDSGGKLLWATYYGTSSKTFSLGLKIGPDNRIYLIGETIDSSGFFSTKSAWKNNSNGQQDLYISKWTTSGNIIWSTYYGGERNDYFKGMDIDSKGNIYLCGTTFSDTGISSSNALQATRIGVTPKNKTKVKSLYITRFDSSGKRQWGTYYGKLNNSSSGIVVDISDNIYFLGDLGYFAPGFTSKGAYIDSVSPNKSTPFLMKLDSLCHRKWATYLDTNSAIVSTPYVTKKQYLYFLKNNYIIRFDTSGKYLKNLTDVYPLSINSICGDKLENLYVSGEVDSSNLVGSGYYNSYLINSTGYNGGSSDDFLYRIDSSGKFINGLYIGGNNADNGYGMAFSNSGDAFLVGITKSTLGLVTAGSHQTIFTGNQDGFLVKVKKINCPKASIYIQNIHVCADSTYKFYSYNFDRSDTYTWKTFGGTISSGQGKDTVTIHWDSSAIGRLWLMRTNSLGCADTASISILGNDLLKSKFIHTPVCSGQPVVFTFTGNDQNVKIVWNLGDGTFDVGKKITHTFYGSNKYQVTASLDDRLYNSQKEGCISYEAQIVSVHTLPSTSWDLKYLYGRTVQFLPNDSTGMTYNWYFGDGDSSDLSTPYHTYARDSIYKVKLVIMDSSGCSSKSDSTLKVIYSSINSSLEPIIQISIEPNPFNEIALLSYYLPTLEKVTIYLYNYTGEQIAVLKNEDFEIGQNKVVVNSSFCKMGQGVYFIKMRIGDSLISRKIVKIAN